MHGHISSPAENRELSIFITFLYMLTCLVYDFYILTKGEKVKNILLIGFLIPAICLANNSVDDQKNAAIRDLTTGCSSSLIAPSFKGFMARTKSSGKTFIDDEEAKRAFELFKTEGQKSDFYKNQLLPAGTKTCQCILATTYSKLRAAKTRVEIESIVKSLKPDPVLSAQCTEKHLKSVLVQTK